MKFQWKIDGYLAAVSLAAFSLPTGAARTRRCHNGPGVWMWLVEKPDRQDPIALLGMAVIVVGSRAK